MSAPTPDIDERVLPARPCSRVPLPCPPGGAARCSRSWSRSVSRCRSSPASSPCRCGRCRISGEFVRVAKADIERAWRPCSLRAVSHRRGGAAARRARGARSARGDGPAGVAGPRRDLRDRASGVARWAGGGSSKSTARTSFPTAARPTSRCRCSPDPQGSQQRVLDLHIALERVLAPLGMTIRFHRAHSAGSVVRDARTTGRSLVMRPDAAEQQDVQVYARTLAKVMAGRLARSRASISGTPPVSPSA